MLEQLVHRKTHDIPVMSYFLEINSLGYAQPRQAFGQLGSLLALALFGTPLRCCL